MKHEWRAPQDWSGIDWPVRGHYGQKRARLLVNYGAGEREISGRALLIDTDGGAAMVFLDAGGWVTNYVVAWKLSDVDRDEIDASQECGD